MSEKAATTVAGAPDLGFVSVPAFKQYVQMAESCGLNCSEILLGLDIDPAVLEDNNKRLPGESLAVFLERVIPLSKDPCFGLHTSAFIQPSSYSVLGYIAMNCRTLGEALARVPSYEKIVGDMGVTRALHEPGQTRVVWRCQFNQALVRRHIIDNVLASWTRYTRWMTNEPNQHPLGVYFEHDPPAPSLMEDYQSVFHCPLYFNQPYSGLVLSDAMLAHRIMQADTQLLQTLEDHAMQILQEIDRGQSIAHKVRNLLRLMLRDELPRKELVAEKLGMNSRTLQRRLKEEGSGYQDVLNELRFELARNFLRNSQLSVEAIGARLGFAEPRSFQRSFKQWSGMTPGAFRTMTTGD